MMTRSKTIDLSVVFELSLYLLIGLSSVMLTISEGFKDGVPPQTFTILLLIAAFLIVDHWQVWSLSWWAAGLLGLLGLVAAFWDVPQYLNFRRGMPILPEERRLDLIFAGAHLLVFLTWIVLFLRKANQQFWWLWGLALLQVAVGASQSTESLYGLLLVVYLFLAVWTLSVFSLLQGQQQFHRAQQVAEFMEDEDEERLAADSLASTGQEAVPRTRTIWRRPSRAIGNVQRDPSASWINLRFVGGVAGTAGVAFVLAVLFFFLVPRHPSIWRKNQAPSDSATAPIVGFSRQLALGDMGQILESRKKVMEVSLRDMRTGERLNIEQYADDMGYEEPLFRGITAIQYEKGRWRSWQPQDTFAGSPKIMAAMKSPSGNWVKQEYRLEPIDSHLLFAIPPAVYGEIDDTSDPISVERLHDVLNRPDSRVGDDPISYSILSPRSPTTKGAIPVNPFQRGLIRSRVRLFKQIPPELLNLRALAMEKAELLTEMRPSDMVIARRLESYLRDSGEFSYTLDADVSDRTVDPVEDFLFNRKTGHCEYFASALTLMLRTVDIPSRLVSGFKGGNYSTVTGRFEVEERHAHAWVEAFIDDSWVILDPTPLSRAESVASVGESNTRWFEFRRLMTGFWSRFIVNLSGGEQRQLLQPFKMLLGDVMTWLRNGRGRFSTFVNSLKQQLRSPERWISWQGGLVTFVFLILLSAAIGLLRVLWRLFVNLHSRYFDSGGLARTVAFYERFRRICSRAGLSRKASQTPREFAVEVERRCRHLLPAADWNGFPVSLIDAYYDVRYGGRLLSTETIDRLDQQLTQFENLLTRPREA